MKVVIFAGGSGRRLWPLSRQASPKQFEPIIGEQSTLQLAAERVAPVYGAQNIYISTNERYLDLVREQLPDIPTANFIGEPARRDLAPAVGLAMAHLSQRGDPGEPVAILWGDNTMQDVAEFRAVLAAAERLIVEDQAKIVFMGETPRFANENLGWIGLGGRRGEFDGRSFYDFESLSYRPALAQCQAMFTAGQHVWNTGYFVTTTGYIWGAYKQHQPVMFDDLSLIKAAIGQSSYEDRLETIYPRLKTISFDDAILEKLDPSQALVLHGEMGWSDPGTLYALKEALSRSDDDNVTKGLVLSENVSDALLYNYEEGKLMAVVGLDGIVVVNMDDALLVVHKDHIPTVKQLVNDIATSDLERFS